MVDLVVVVYFNIKCIIFDPFLAYLPILYSMKTPQYVLWCFHGGIQCKNWSEMFDKCSHQWTFASVMHTFNIFLDKAQLFPMLSICYRNERDNEVRWNIEPIWFNKYTSLNILLSSCHQELQLYFDDFKSAFSKKPIIFGDHFP